MFSIDPLLDVETLSKAIRKLGSDQLPFVFALTATRLAQRVAAAEQRSRAAGNTITAQLSQAAEADSRVRTELLGRIGALTKLYAGAADESRIAGQTCERSFDSLGGG